MTLQFLECKSSPPQNSTVSVPAWLFVQKPSLSSVSSSSSLLETNLVPFVPKFQPRLLVGIEGGFLNFRLDCGYETRSLLAERVQAVH